MKAYFLTFSIACGAARAEKEISITALDMESLKETARGECHTMREYTFVDGKKSYMTFDEKWEEISKSIEHRELAFPIVSITYS
jgi:hypothetical protein